MSFQQKRDAACALLAARGIKRRYYAPTIVTLLWRAGVEIPPPHFASFLPTFLFAAGMFSASWGVIMWILFWSHQNMSGLEAVGYSVFTGVVVGVVVANYYQNSARKHSIPTWRDFKGGTLG
jgi:hypothetical protein